MEFKEVKYEGEERIDIKKGEDKEKIKKINSMKSIGKIDNGIEVVEIERLRKNDNGEVLEKKKLKGIGLGWCKEEEREKNEGNEWERDGVVLREEIGDIVKKKSKVKKVEVEIDSGDEMVWKRVIGFKIEVIDLRKKGNEEKKMIVKSIVVINIEMNNREDIEEIGNEF